MRLLLPRGIKGVERRVSIHVSRYIPASAARSSRRGLPRHCRRLYRPSVRPLSRRLAAVHFNVGTGRTLLETNWQLRHVVARVKCIRITVASHDNARLHCPLIRFIYEAIVLFRIYLCRSNERDRQFES